MDAPTLRLALTNASNPDDTTRNAAEEQLKASFAGNPENHLFLLSQELADEVAPQEQTRALAGLTLKNFMTSKDQGHATKLANDWLALNPDARTKIKANSLISLGSGSKGVRLAAAQVISKIATIELPKVNEQNVSQWEDLMPTLLTNIVTPEESPAGVTKKEAALQTLGYICEEIAKLETDCLASKSNEILTAVVAGMRTQETNLAIKLAATQALSNALEFVNRNFEVDGERDYIMTVICEACTFTGPADQVAKVNEVKESAFLCLNRIAELYYNKLPGYIQTLLEMSLESINTQPDEVARAAIGFWHEVCDVEYELIDDSECHNFVKGASTYLVPVLLRCMTMQEEGQDEDSFNKSTEAASCLVAVATVVADDVVQAVMAFVKENIGQPNWRLREAAVMAFGSIMEGPDSDKLQDMVQEMMNFLVKYLDDPEDLVKNSSAWTISRICEFAPSALSQEAIPQLCHQFILAIPKSEAGTAEKLCWAIHHLSNHVAEDATEDRSPNALSPVFPALVRLLIETGDREDATESSLRATAYEALNILMVTADESCISTFLTPTLLPMLGERLNATFALQPLNADDLNAKNEWQAYFCGALQTCITTIVPPADSAAANPLLAQDGTGMTVADKFMHLFLQVFSSQNTTAAQEAMLAVGSIVAALPNGQFDRYMQPFGPMLVACLQAVSEPALCVVAISITSDISNQLKAKMLLYSDQIVEVLLSSLSRPEVDSQIAQVHDYIKPGIYSCLGDIAMAIGAGMEKYLQYWFTALQAGCNAALLMSQEVQQEGGYDEDTRYYLNKVMEGLLDGYVGIVQGLKDAEQAVPGASKAFLQPVAFEQGSLVLLRAVANDKEKTDRVLQHAVGLVGDLADNYPEMRPQLLQEVQVLISQAQASEDQETKDYGKWALTKINGGE